MNSPSEAINGSTILIVDDMPNNISVLYETLTQFDFKVLVARDGKKRH